MQPQAATVVDVQSSSPGPSSPPQHRILNRVSTLFGAKKKNVTPAEFVQEQAEESQADSLYDADDAASRVDSMYSSLHSRRSGYRPSAANNIPAPLRTVQLENPIVHLPTPPTPPANDKHPSPSPEPKKIITPPSSLSSSQKKVEDVEEQFKLLLKEYAPSADHLSSVNNLTFEQKELLLRSSRSPALLKKNSTFSHVMPSFSLKATFGLKNKSSKPALQPNHHSTSDVDLHSLFYSDANNTATKAKTTPARYSRTRTSLYNGTGIGPGGGSSERNSTSRRSKLKSTPEYFVHLLQMTHVRDLEDAEVLDLRVFLRSVVVSWTSEFLALGGYEAIANLFKQMKEAQKRHPNDNRILQHLGKCLKAIMTHQPMGTQIVLLNPVALLHVRDILFGPASKKQKQVYGLEIATKSLLLNLLCTLATLQTNCSADVEYVHGYDVLRRLLLDRPTDRLVDDEDKKKQIKHQAPFPMTLKTDPQEILQMIMENDPNGQAIGREYEWDRDELKPRYTAWMRELQYTVERHIETITFLAQVLNYDFKSAYRQIKARQSGMNEEEQEEEQEEASGSVMTEEGVVDYIVTHLRLIRTVVTTPPTSYVGCYDEREQEKIRLELMLSGFDKISKILIQCPHPTVRESYINYLRPLMSPCADLSRPKEQLSSTTPPPLPDRNKQYRDLDELNPNDDEDDETNACEIYVYADDEHPEEEEHQNDGVFHKQWKYDEEPYDDIFLESAEEDEEDFS
ncbi:hypothetical protein G6F57_008774 [Rhizopus arrhizus]|uniref:Formin GTPase-binding domain-containing protein n=1 Tax=Rhizopus oryzae TaxID=64495 RepID=A0A9P6X5Z3_RHIOR|nr:hypothetical protein G6F23_009319 [Rhizopus arrhizus]KAG1405889.1 hypothetical protein G6F58_009933 [Rhizopus delemar]KAG0759978.1 hypothetical protein G6F24_008667 [Rhizopus arrhizus]KAG0785886.1 hypothetical protein G6F22_007802 [Rhizopus arrhizus]KAG0791196.1 hypothetical protein G6F21_005253 [Rhizopus arrhizus]